MLKQFSPILKNSAYCMSSYSCIKEGGKRGREKATERGREGGRGGREREGERERQRSGDRRRGSAHTNE